MKAKLSVMDRSFVLGVSVEGGSKGFGFFLSGARMPTSAQTSHPVIRI
jgi:hypothetical protein